MTATLPIPQAQIDALPVMHHDADGHGRVDRLTAAAWFGEPIKLGRRLSDDDAAKLAGDLAWEISNETDESPYLVSDADGWCAHIYHTSPLTADAK